MDATDDEDDVGRGRGGGSRDGAAEHEGRRRRLADMLGEGYRPLHREATLSGRAPEPRPSPARRLERVCRVAAAVIEVDGVGVTMLDATTNGVHGPGARRDQPAAVGAATGQMEGLSLTVQEGPTMEAFAAGLPVLAPDLAAETTRWPGFAPAALAAGVRAVFSLPLQLGAVRLGTLDLHRRRPGELAREQFADALALAGLATETLLDLTHPDSQDDAWGWLPHVHADVHVASGMVSVHAGISIPAALMRIRGYAFAHDRTVDEVARHIIRRELVLDEGNDPGPRDPENTS